MTEEEKKQKEADKDLIQRIEDARDDRNHHASTINRFYSYALPHRRQVSTNLTESGPRSLDEQDDIFDETLQQALQDFAADMSDAFTPMYKPWAPLVPSRTLTDGQKKQATAAIKKLEADIYREIAQSNFYEQSQQCWLDLGGSCAGMLIPYAPRGQKIKCRPITMAHLLIEYGDEGELTGRWMEFHVRKRNFKSTFSASVIKELEKENSVARAKPDQKFVFTQGCHRIPGGKPSWEFTIVFESKKVVHRKRQMGEGANAIPVLRWEDGVESAWGPGAAAVALSPAGVTQELEYLNLKNLGKVVDPAWAYTMDGLFNPLNGVDTGDFIPMEAGTEFKELASSRNLNEKMFEADRRREVIKRVLFQDRPEQEGKTPPTAAQWLDQRAMKDKRLQLARTRIYKEWVVQVLNRFLWIMQKRGDAPPIEIDGVDGPITVRFESPASKASDSEEVTFAINLLQSFAGIFGETFFANVNAHETMEAMVAKMGTQLIKLQPFEQQPEAVKQLLGNMRNLSNNG